MAVRKTKFLETGHDNVPEAWWHFLSHDLELCCFLDKLFNVMVRIEVKPSELDLRRTMITSPGHVPPAWPGGHRDAGNRESVQRNVRKASFKIADDDKREHKSTNVKIIKPTKRFGVTGAGRLHCPWPYRSNGREIEAVPGGTIRKADVSGQLRVTLSSPAGSWRSNAYAAGRRTSSQQTGP